jgi:protein TonB
MAMLVRKVIPVYPPIARTARISGVVRLIGTIGKDGSIQNLEIVSGHPMLARAALEAVRQWVYKPTLLNGIPVEVVSPIEVNFTLGR